jgi:hypothetical protein
MVFKICEQCGANLDPGEKCDCNEISEVLRMKYEKLIDAEHFQTRMKFTEKEGVGYGYSG